MPQWKPSSSSFKCVKSSYLLHAWCQGDVKTILCYPTIQLNGSTVFHLCKHLDKTFLMVREKALKFKQVQHHNMSEFVIPKKKETRTECPDVDECAHPEGKSCPAKLG